MPTTPPLLRRLLLGAAALLCLPLGAQAAEAADNWPQAKPITWIVGFAPGGSLDVITRLAARQLADKTGQSVVVENRPGASGAIALQTAAKAAADGYTLVSVPGPILFNQRQPDVGKELMAVASLAQGPMVLVGPNDGRAPKNLKELIAAMRTDRSRWSYASSGTGTSQHLAGELFNSMAGTTMVHVPYKGGGQAVTDVIGGQLPLAMLGVTPVLPHLQSGKLRAYAVTTVERLPTLPEVPTMAQAGLAGYAASQWYVVATPRGTPAARIERLNRWIGEIMASPELQPALEASGSVAGSGSPAAVQDFVAADTRKWRALARKAKLDLE